MITDEEVMRDASPAAEHALGFPRSLLLWLLFFLVLFGLGYPTLNRYDPRKLGPDQQSYYNMVLGRATLDNDLPFCFRVLVPELAKPFYVLGNGRVRSWDPLLAVGVGASADLMGTVNRPLFSVLGPLLSLSAAILIAERPASRLQA